MRFALAGVLALWLCSCAKPKFAIDPSLESELKVFFQVKEQQSARLVAASHQVLPREFRGFFRAGTNGDWRAMDKAYKKIAAHSHAFAGTKIDERFACSAWQTVNEAYRAYEQLALVDPYHSLDLARNLIESIPAGSIYFADDDPSRFITTFLTQTRAAKADFFVLTQNQLSDWGYIEFISELFGERIAIPTGNDMQAAFNDLLPDRKSTSFLPPLQAGGALTGRRVGREFYELLQLNGKLSRFIFEHNPTRRFFLTEAYPQEWMNPHLSPHGLVLEIKPEPIPELSEETLETDRRFWDGYIRPLIGGWVVASTSIKEVSLFAQRVLLERDLKGFQGDPLFVKTSSPWSGKPYHIGSAFAIANLRSAIGRVYAWRAGRAKTGPAKDRLAAAADLAYLQALALCPYSPKAGTEYIDYLVAQARFSEALEAGLMIKNFYPGDAFWEELVKALQSKRANPASSEDRNI